MSRFDIYLHDRLAGKLDFDQFGKLTFRYEDAYIVDNAPPISMTMPLADREYDDLKVFPFIENLFPEGDVREQIAINIKTANNNFEKFVRTMGGDVAGALSMYPEDVKPVLHDEGCRERLGLEALSQLILDIKDKPFLVSDEHNNSNRLSLAGAQNKLPVVVKNGQLYRATHQPSTHIIKPAPIRKTFETMVYNEYVCMRAADKAGLNVAAVNLVDVITGEGIEYDALLVTRYDREDDCGIVTRLHQEDACQLHSITSSYKYEEDGGKGFEELFALVRKYGLSPAKDINELLKRILFNLLIGNNDMHNKNYSFIHKRGKLELSPAYDLLSTQLYPDISETMGMFIGQEKAFFKLKAYHFDELMRAIGVNLRSPLRKRFIQFCDKALACVINEVKACEEHCYGGDYKTISHLAKIAENNHKHLSALLLGKV